MARSDRKVGRFPIVGKRSGRRLGHAVARKTQTQRFGRKPASATIKIPEFSGDRMLAREQGRGTKSLRLLEERRKMEGTPVTGRPPLLPRSRKMQTARRKKQGAK
jgi:hypothetical protein